MGIAAGAGVRLIVPVGDACRADGMPSFLDFAGGVGKYISTHTDLEFTLMVDSTHNAYHLDDSYFDLPIDSGDNTTAVSEPSQKRPTRCRSHRRKRKKAVPIPTKTMTASAKS